MTRLVLEQPVGGESGPILVRSKLRAVSRRMGFSEVQREQMELVCTEMLTNQLKFARGTGLLQIWELGEPHAGLDLFALDYGPGIADLALALSDGFTTARTLGRGLGAVGRLAGESAIYSVTEQVAASGLWHGTALWARFHVRPPGADDYQIGRFLRAYGDAPDNGDCVHLLRVGSRLRWMHADGLGHGTPAARAVQPLPALMDGDSPCCTLLDRMSRSLHGGRGAVALVGEVDPDGGRLRLCGVGDLTAAVIQKGAVQNFGFSPGVLGHVHRRFAPIEVPLPDGALVLTASDGLRRNWERAQFPGLYNLHPQLVAYLLGNLLGRFNDDRSVLAVRAVGP